MKKTAYRQNPIDVATAAAVLVFAALLSLFAVRNNDIWWLLAVARRIVETRAFITEDPFTFTVTGAAWAPQSYLSALIFHAVHSAVSAWGLIVIRAVLVVGIFAVSLRTLSRVGASWAIAAPVVMVALLNAHSRFLVRAHLFEYLFLVLLVWFLMTARDRKGKSFFVFPLALQVLWVNMHPSFMLAPVVTVLFFGGEWVAERVSRQARFIRPYNESGYDWRRVGLLVVLMLAACVVDPHPALFLTQPFGGEQRELISRFTLEWRSPFDPALKHGAFHPYYEILLGLAALSIVLSIGRLRLAPALLIAATAYLSFQAHRFRVEFALVSVPMIFALLQSSPVVDSLRRRLAAAKNGAMAAQLAAVALTVLVVIAALDRVAIGDDVADRYPAEALDFVRAENIAHRPYNTIGQGSYLVWHLYGERQSFIDGRNFAPALYRDFLACQMNDQGRRTVAQRYKIDSFILPPIEKADAGIERLHRSLAQDDAWTLCYLDRHAWIYVRNDAVDAAWLEGTGLRTYHPLTLHNRRLSEAEVSAARADLERAVAVSPEYARTHIDLALIYAAAGERRAAMREVERALEIDPNNKAALNLRERLQAPG
jgi:tetratricopeptide (TPR) repeat protein